ncbi:MAG: 5-methyltetrahydropteroyltriglutamate--homocysteine S-methyltransferase, partial [Planctomycetes bacterium]|nr:5-methyltetrahydropteroyltriglutamate--homocysteine S-methyltransferase [Planctomycetota bacterium]
MLQTAILGYPRIGPRRELKRLLESYWKGDLALGDFQQQRESLRLQNIQQLKTAGLDIIPSNDACDYDQVLDTTCMLGAIPQRFSWDGKTVDAALACRLARGQAPEDHGTEGVAALGMTKWFDTNYHYLVPELSAELNFSFADHSIVERYLSAKAAGIETRPVLIGPLTWLLLATCIDDSENPLIYLPRILPVYQEVLAELAQAGARAVQIDEPILSSDLDAEQLSAVAECYRQLCAGITPDITVACYFGPLADNLSTFLSLPVAELHIDALRGAEELDQIAATLAKDHQRQHDQRDQHQQRLSIGIIDGRNVWTSDLQALLQRLRWVADVLGTERLTIASSCSLMHVPVDVEQETKIDGELKSWLSFARQKVDEILCLGSALVGNDVSAALNENTRVLESRRHSDRVHRAVVQQRLAAATETDEHRQSIFAQRKHIQQATLQLPLLPTTTIGSFPQTAEIRRARADFRSGELSQEQYDGFLRKEIRQCIQRQEDVGLDVLV